VTVPSARKILIQWRKWKRVLVSNASPLTFVNHIPLVFALL
jgi:hypothetical protein